MGIVSEYVRTMIAKQVDDNGLVIWYDPNSAYSEVVDVLDLHDTTVLCYEGSFIRLRWEIDQKKLMDGEEPPRLVVYVPLAQEETHHALIELEASGVVMQPGQQPPSRNTRLALVARNALKGVLSEENLTQVVEQTDAGKLTLADLDTLADKDGQISRGVIALIFGTGNSQEVALSFLDSDRFDESVIKKESSGDLVKLLRRDFGLDVPDGTELTDLRKRLARHVLMTDLVSVLGDAVPSKMASVPVASTSTTTAACKALARTWRLRRDTRESYVAAARHVEQEFGLASLEFDPRAIERLETFPTIEKTLLRYAENRLLEKSDGEILTLAESRLSRFWCVVEPRLQAHWALIASVAEVLLEADRVEQALKRAPTSVTGMIKEYVEGAEPWCLLDTHHRHMESLWYNFEPHLGGDYESIEKLIVRARQRYTAVGSDLAQKFISCIDKEKLSSKGVIHQHEIFEKHVKPSLGKEKLAYLWVDALRFEMARELTRLLKGDFEVELKPALAFIPTLTEIGMAALLPNVHECARIVNIGNGKLALEVKGTVIKNRKDRVDYLRDFTGVEFYSTKIENLLPKPSKNIREGMLNARLILITSQEIDELCEKDNIAQARRQMDDVLNDLRRAIRVLLDSGIERIVLASDHGYIFAEELSEDMKIDPPGGETEDLHRRVWIGQGGNMDDAFLRAHLTDFDIKGELDMAVPWTFACFKCPGGARAYFHGGLSPQELIIPLMILRPLAKVAKILPSDIDWKLIPGSQKLSTRFFSIQITGANIGLLELVPPKVRVELRAKGKNLSRAVSASYGFDEATGDVTLRVDEKSPNKIAVNTVTLMVVNEVDQKSVNLYLIDASTGVELTQIGDIEVAISI